MELKKKLVSLASAIALAAGVVAVSSAPANALPGGCVASFSTDGKAYGNCSSGTGQYRIGIPCKNWFTAWHQYSSWKNVGIPATVSCPLGSGVWWDISPSGPHVLIEKRN